MNGLTIRAATSHDSEALERLARLNEHPPLHGPALLAERGAVAIAALELGNGALIVDPSEPSSDVAVHALRLRRYELLRPGGAVARRPAARATQTHRPQQDVQTYSSDDATSRPVTAPETLRIRPASTRGRPSAQR